jgi:hypothetical protein
MQGAGDPLQRVHDTQRPAVDVDVRPVQNWQLAATKAEHHREHEVGVRSVRLGQLDQLVSLLGPSDRGARAHE